MTIGPGITRQNAVALQGVPVAVTAPTDTQLLEYVGATGLWTPTSVSIGTGSVTQITMGSGLSSTQSPLTTAGTMSVDGSVVALLAAANAFTKSQSGPTAALTLTASHFAWNADTVQIATLDMSASATLDNPTSMRVGTFVAICTQSGGGSHTLAYGNAFKWPGGTAPTLSTGATAVDILTFVCDGSSMYGVAQLAFA